MSRSADVGKATRRRGSETRTRLLNAAREQFAGQGYDGASLRMIAASADITLALLHYHFGSKRDLYRAVWVEQYSSEAEQTRRSAYAQILPQDSRETALRRVVGAAIAGPAELLQDKRGAEFITILARELADPKAAERGLLDEFISPVGQDTQRALRKIMPDLSEAQFRTGLLLTVAASQQLIHFSTLAALKVDAGTPEQLPSLIPSVIDFLVQGWLSLEH
jgi:AcrR family transcriptional regulator